MEDAGLVCEACWTNVFDTVAIQKFWIQESFDFCYTTTWAQIVQSAESACNWCGFLASILPSPDTPQWPNDWTPSTDLLVSLVQPYLSEVANATPKGLNQIWIDFCSEPPSYDWRIGLNLFVDNIDDSAGFVTARPLQWRLNSAEAYSQIRQWLDQCSEHVDCDRASLNANLPSRLIEVAPADSPGVPRLRSTKGLKGSYLALSYCWGSDQPYVLTTKNYERFMKEICVKMLPQTILDAIEVTKTLGFKYLWVDALCIMQDSTEAAARDDMNQELAIMAQIYMNAAMTIVASCVSSVTESFLEDRPRSAQSYCDVPCRLTPRNSFVVHIQEHLGHDERSEPINKRAWTFQERLLSPRLLIYASHTLQWQCRTLKCNLGGSYNDPSLESAPRLPSTQVLLLKGAEEKQKSHQPSPDIPHLLLQHWLRIVTSYISRKSSLPSDKLPALSALAATYAPVFGPEYFAGIWAKSAVQQLCWRSPDSRRFLTPPAQYRAPSWSWAALDGDLIFLSFPLTGDVSTCVPYRHFKIVEWLIRPKALNVGYGEVTAGKLIVTTILRTATFNPSRSPTICFDAAPNEDLHGVKAAPSSAELGLIETAGGISDTIEDNFARPVHCLIMYHINGPESPQIGGLMLVESSGHDGSYRRMGLYSANISAFEGYPLDTFSII